MPSQEPVDLVSSDEQPDITPQKLPNSRIDVMVAPTNGHCGQHGQSYHQSTSHKQQGVHQEGKPPSIDTCHVQDAAPGSSVPVIAQTAQEEQVQRPNSSINPSVAPIRRFKGVPYAPDADSTQFLTNMGFSHDQAIRALKVTQGNIERAANWLLSGM